MFSKLLIAIKSDMIGHRIFHPRHQRDSTRIRAGADQVYDDVTTHWIRPYWYESPGEGFIDLTIAQSSLV